MAYIAKLTAAGAAKITAASAGGPVLSLTQIAVGDGGGNPVPPPSDPAPASMVNIVYQTQINSLFISASDPTIMMAELVIPSGTGGFAIREIGIFDSTGTLCAYGNFPDTYKPAVVDGATCDMDTFVAIKVGSSDNVQLVIDTSIVIATRPWVVSTITAAYLIPGGLTGQVLTKSANTDGAFQWTDLTSAVNIAVDVIKEVQTAVAGQTIFTLLTMTTDGVAVYVEGLRQGSFTVLNSTQIQLSSALDAGNEVIFAQNEPNEPLQLRRTITGRGYFLGQLA